MAGERALKRLGEICEFRGGQGFPQKHQGAIVGEYPFIKVSDMELPGNRHRITRANHWIDEATRKELRAKPHPATSTVFAKIGIALTYNRRRLLSRPTIVDNNMMAAVPIESEVEPLFLYYLLKDTDFNEVVSGTALPFINGSDLAKMEVLVPSLAEQKAIAAVLGALDDKIELNRRMNATLEAMARALFQSWFVDFDPVRAKLDGRKPVGMDETTAALFPEHLEDSPLGPIPEGWEIKPFGELADVNWGDTSTTKKSYVPEGFTAYSAAGPDGLLPYHDYDRTGVVVSAIGSAGLSWLALGKWSCIKNTIRFWATTPGISTEYLYQATKGQEKWPIRGSVQPFISQGDARAMRILAPANGLAERFGKVVRPWLTKIEADKQQSRTLATLRDTLLPKLLSGEIRVPQAGALAEKAA